MEIYILGPSNKTDGPLLGVKLRVYFNFHIGLPAVLKSSIVLNYGGLFTLITFSPFQSYLTRVGSKSLFRFNEGKLLNCVKCGPN